MPLSAARRRQNRAQRRFKTLNCYRCGETFKAVRKTARFCSETCRQPLSPLAADKRVRHYFKRHRLVESDYLPQTLAELLRAMGLTARDGRMLEEICGEYYFPARYAQSRPKPFPSGQASPAWASTWNNLGFPEDSLNLRIQAK
jgi:hypothetical protein